MTKSISIEKSGSELEGSERERIIRKIKRCLALGESSNQNEAEMAMRQAQVLMRAYRLNESDVHAESVGCVEHNTGMVRMSSWQRSLAGAAAQAFNCKMLIQRYKSHPVTFAFIGVMPAAELAAYAYDSLLAQIKASRQEFQKQYGATRRQADDFCVAWVCSVRAKITKFAQEAPVPGTQANALVLVEKQEHAAIDAWIANKKGEVTVRKEAKRNYNRAAFHLGIKAGEQACLNQAVNGARSDPLMLS